MLTVAVPAHPAKPCGGSLIFNDIMIIAKDRKRKISLFVVTTGKSGKLTVVGERDVIITLRYFKGLLLVCPATPSFRFDLN